MPTAPVEITEAEDIVEVEIEEVFVTHVTIGNSNFGSGNACIWTLHNDAKNVIIMREPKDGDVHETQRLVIDDAETRDYHFVPVRVTYDSSKIEKVTNNYKDR
jgi:hypothetical protein